MRRILIVLSFLCICLHIFAQNDVTKFLGIPVDGPKSEMIRELKAKGFILNGGGMLTNFLRVDLTAWMCVFIFLPKMVRLLALWFVMPPPWMKRI